MRTDGKNLKEIKYCKNICLYISIILLNSFFTHLNAQRLSRDLNVDILINQAGYVPTASKICLLPDSPEREFRVIETNTGKASFAGIMQATAGDMGNFAKGDFSGLNTPGTYYILADTFRSYPFEISASIYDPAKSLIVHYFSKQRCGASTSGYLTPCHIDDGIRMDNGKHQQVSGGWHDASDLRKWVGATIYGMIGLSRAYADGRPDRDLRNRIIDELQWGNRYFLAMQEPEGYIMSYIGGDVQKHSDSNRWTDNLPGTSEGTLQMAKPNAGQSRNDMLIWGNQDDRIIRTDPLDLTGQFNFVIAEARMAQIMRKSDRAYAGKCRDAARKCFDWCIQQNDSSRTGVISFSIQAAIELYRATGDKTFRRYAVRQVNNLKNLQSKKQSEKPFGFFTETSAGEPHKNIWNGSMELISVCEMIHTFPKHNDTDAWKEMIRDFCQGYIEPISKRNAFGIVPFGLFADSDPGGNRKIGRYWYRYFMAPNPEWWVGINANLASSGVGLFMASEILNDPPLKALAQRQLDWILGNNPFNSSTLIGIGHNHPKHFPGSTFQPQTPVIEGAVMNGLGGDELDEPVIGDGNWQISEYWTPMVAYTLWLLAEMSSS
ncbi:MAG: glycoside hydrolase family 9 protein [Saprospiraceae bacterium]|nr:glycoside hydrolase family 9 protein [Saprospiraceae bacterium]